jgi:ABC-type antimicrobial peptide transport system permease subunit
MVGEIRELLREVDTRQPVAKVRTLAEVRADSLASPRLTALLLLLFALLALIVTATGIGGVLALTVSQRTHEIGIRIALGARRGEVVAMVLRQGLSLLGIGLALGAAGALLLARLLTTLLYGIAPTDPVTFVGVGLVLFAVAVLACVLPARRAAGIDPVSALRAS